MNGPWNSQMSLLMSGKLDPKAQFWVSLAEFNGCVYSGQINDLEPSLVKRLHGRKPFTTAEGMLATAVDFFGMFVGAVKWSEEFSTEPLLTEMEAEKKGSQLLSKMEEAMLEQMVSRSELWARLLPVLSKHSDDDPRPVQRWLVGLGPYTPEVHLIYGEVLETFAKTLK